MWTITTDQRKPATGLAWSGKQLEHIGVPDGERPEIKRAKTHAKERRKNLREKGLRPIEVWLTEDQIAAIDFFVQKQDSANRVEGLAEWATSMRDHVLSDPMVTALTKRYQLPTVYHGVVVALQLLNHLVEQHELSVEDAAGLECVQFWPDGRVRRPDEPQPDTEDKHFRVK
jgi:hypothetical protein